MKETELIEQKTEPDQLTESGEIISLDGQFAYVQVQKQSGCHGCASSGTCGTSALARYFSDSSRGLIKVNNTVGGAVGDRVELSLDESQLVKHAFMAYGLPLLGLFVFAVLFKALGLQFFNLNELYQDIAAIIGGLLGVVLGWLFTHKRYRPVRPEITLISSKELSVD